MHNVIQLLPDSIANQIAAGEVVQRPASVVKELLENSVDAGAKSVQLVVRDAGRTLVQVIDDGAGMTETDARMSFERHATSKIRSSDDLFRIKTMGFRGEALASIAAVAQVEMRTRRAAEELGTLVRIEGSEIKAQEQISCLPGTNLLVKNLFFNVPARRNFLKSNSVEMRHILDEFQRVALAHPEVAFSLFQDDREVFNLPSGKLSRRIVDMFGKGYRDQMAYCEEQTPYVTVRGYIGKPESAKKTRNEQYFFVNNRFIKHNYLHHAVLGAYEGTLPDNYHPFYVLFIDIDPSHIDINIHPTKTEIKFDDERSVYAIMMAAVRKAMGVYNLSPSLDFDSNVNFLSSQNSARDRRSPDATDKPGSDLPRPVMPAWASGGLGHTSARESNTPEKPLSAPRFDQFPPNASQFEAGGPREGGPRTGGPSAGGAKADVAKPLSANANLIIERARALNRDEAGSASVGQNEPAEWLPPAVAAPAGGGGETHEAIDALTLGSKANQIPFEPMPTLESPNAGGHIMQVQGRYLLAPVKSGVLVVDQRRAYERILYDQFHAALTKRNGASQQLLFPKTVSVSAVDYQLAIDLRDELTGVGFQFDELGANTFVLRGIPALTPGENEEELFSNLLAQLRADTGRLKLERSEALARSLARRSALRHQNRLSDLESKALIDQLFASSTPGYTPTGEPITTVLTLDKIQGLFKL
ncbi:DNA mismatch repair endonuclease MutL [Rudanella paleaurantiibacter]|uniref:DNA mismatch repair protein MutL n=1 Tax=Rudanella paleaurantiibacter TaxID=2614655 RepID=A0A7J5U2B6_9BACT|nr:DNA mismatch repair endonuclease MutL [Rudanella paleaurantiibacter]KAB7731826.1 DNA mismatch repair endonuclease MutL [Rudanella paleaurantiibacter]